MVQPLVSPPPLLAGRPPFRLRRRRPTGWHCLLGTAIGGPAGARIRVNAVLLHPQHGVALVDVAPRSTPRAEDALRQCLAEGGLRAWPAAELPVVYLCLTPEELRGLPALLRAVVAQRPWSPRRPDPRWLREAR
ncbi:hypothetical protein, partial [Paracraurococcus ruber]